MSRRKTSSSPPAADAEDLGDLLAEWRAAEEHNIREILAVEGPDAEEILAASAEADRRLMEAIAAVLGEDLGDVDGPRRSRAPRG